MVKKAEVEKAYALLNLNRQIVGIKLVQSKSDFDQANAKEIDYPLSYCVAVKHATNGIALKMTKKFSGCGGSTRALGLEPPTESFFNGADGCALGLYKSAEIAGTVAKQMKICPSNTYGVIIKPLEQFESDPDVVIIIGNGYQMMRIVQGYAYVYGLQPNFNLLGNQAICVECTAYPIATNEINVSLLCSGTRFLAKWQDNEMAVGIPIDKYTKVIEGVYLTVNSVEMPKNKQTIQAQLGKLGYNTPEINFEDPYYLRLEKKKQKLRREVNKIKSDG